VTGSTRRAHEDQRGEEQPIDARATASTGRPTRSTGKDRSGRDCCGQTNQPKSVLRLGPRDALGDEEVTHRRGRAADAPEDVRQEPASIQPRRAPRRLPA